MTEHSSGPPVGSEDQGEALNEFRTLVQAAFEQAQSSGKPGWQEMTSAVLKNRILDLTDREFSEERYGSPSFLNLVRRVPDLIDIVDINPPFRLRIRSMSTGTSNLGTIEEELASDVDSLGATGTSEDWRHLRVRDDLWRALLDYSSGKQYVLDPSTNLARPKEDADAEFPQIPTVTRDEVSSWRQEFIEKLADENRPDLVGELQVWATGKGRLADLPRSLRGQWAEFFKRKVSDRLTDWYRSRGSAPPPDMFIQVHNAPPAETTEEVVRTRQLQGLIIRAVRSMTYEELTGISLPAYVLLRISVDRKGGKE